jgi:hypothetical protein
MNGHIMHRFAAGRSSFTNLSHHQHRSSGGGEAPLAADVRIYRALWSWPVVAEIEPHMPTARLLMRATRNGARDGAQ